MPNGVTFMCLTRRLQTIGRPIRHFKARVVEEPVPLFKDVSPRAVERMEGVARQEAVCAGPGRSDANGLPSKHPTIEGHGPPKRGIPRRHGDAYSGT